MPRPAKGNSSAAYSKRVRVADSPVGVLLLCYGSEPQASRVWHFGCHRAAQALVCVVLDRTAGRAPITRCAPARRIPPLTAFGRFKIRACVGACTYKAPSSHGSQLGWLASIANLGCCLVSLLIGAIGALGQRKLKRLFAYGAIAHVGYLLLGLCCATAEGVHWMFFYVALYAMQSLGAFCLLMLPARRDWVFSFQGVCYLSELYTLIKTNRVLAACFSITLFSMAGIPPLAGFLAKYFILLSAFNSQLYLIAFTGALLTVISCVARSSASPRFLNAGYCRHKLDAGLRTTSLHPRISVA